MKIKPFTLEDKKELINLLTGSSWGFHSKPKLSRTYIEQQIQSGYYTQKGQRTFLIFQPRHEVAGYFRIFDLGEDVEDDGIPLFDIRIATDKRGQGIGKQATDWLTGYVFTNYPKKNSIEATTRHDNIAMQRVLIQCKYAKESHYRQGWILANGERADAVGYSILRQDWKSGVVTPVNWD